MIPVYKSTPSEWEKYSFIQCLKIFQNRSIVIVTGLNVELTEYHLLSEQDNRFSVEYFNDTFFESIEGYNKLLLSVEFYKRFLKSKYLLLYQLDCWIFKDSLDFWCNLNYDYVGAPWIDWPWSEFHARTISVPRRVVSKFGFTSFNMVGNGGLSLRKIKSSIFNLSLFQQSAKRFTQNEDYFFSFYINSYNPFFKVAPLKLALKFSFDENPQKAFVLNNYELPMGCHAWPKYLEFWESKMSNQ